jgi:hypothetical protein
VYAGSAAPPRQIDTWSPQAQEAARRAYAAGCCQPDPGISHVVCGYEQLCGFGQVLSFFLAFTGARSLLYGSAVGIGGIVLLGTVTFHLMDVHSPADFRQRMQDWAAPYAHSMKASLLPVKNRMRVISQHDYLLNADY